MSEELRRAAGSLLVVGLGGTELTGLERAWLKLVRPAGIILFQRNIVDAGQTRELLREAAGLCAAHSLRCVDVEGGTVNRLRVALAPLPSAQEVAGAALKKTTAAPSAAASAPDDNRKNVRSPRPRKRDLGHAQSLALAREHGELIGRAVRAFGFNTTLAPVLDLGLPESVAVMGSRCAAATPEGVTAYARGFLAGLKAVGVAGCGKHFPGLGGGTLDSHLETPAIERAWATLWRADMEPYRALRDQLPMVMVSHAAFPQTRGGRRPASVSAYWVESVLRKRIGYRGIVFSDDLEMGGILKFLPIEEAVVAAVRAGTDLMEICHSAELILRAYEALLDEGERSAVFRKLLLERARETARKRAKTFAAMAPAPGARQMEALGARVARFGEKVRAER